MGPITPNPRPALLTAIAAFHLVSGISLIALAAAGVVSAGEWVLIPNLASNVVTIAMFGFGIHNVLVSVGLFSGFRWGWFLAQFGFVLAVVRNAMGFVLIENVKDEFGELANGVEVYFFSYVARAIVAMVLTQYMLTRTVSDQYRVDENTARRFTLVAAVVCILLAATAYVLRRVLV